MKVVVTGATGFLGSNLSQRLRDSGAEVYATGRDQKAGEALKKIGAQFLPIDLGRDLYLRDLPKEIDAVVHCAALSSPWGRAEEFYLSNVVATKNISEYALRAGCRRFVHISSPSIYVDRCDRLNVIESDPLPTLTLNHYIDTKRQAEIEIDQATARGLPAITLRPQGIVGRGDRSIFPRILKAARRGFIPRIGVGETRTDLTHVGNVVESIMCALEASPEFVGQKYNITNGEPVEIYSVIEELMRRLNVSFRWKKLSFRKAYAIASALEWTSRNFLAHREPPLTRYTVCALGVSRTLNISKAKRELKYNPRMDLQTALKEVAEQMRMN